MKFLQQKEFYKKQNMKVAIVKYNAGNVQSVIYALNRLGIDPILTDDEEELRSADKVIFPGVGEASTAMSYLKKANLEKVLPTLTQPFLGVCIGQQLMCEHSEEGDTTCLGIFPLKVKRFPQGVDKNGDTIKVPHMGWNSLKIHNNHPLFKGLDEESYVYYVHSYYCELGKETIVETDYIHPYSASLQKDNFYAVQFHPEKSGKVGEQIIKNFLEL